MIGQDGDAVLKQAQVQDAVTHERRERSRVGITYPAQCGRNRDNLITRAGRADEVGESRGVSLNLSTIRRGLYPAILYVGPSHVVGDLRTHTLDAYRLLHTSWEPGWQVVHHTDTAIDG